MHPKMLKPNHTIWFSDVLTHRDMSSKDPKAR
ncbi:hypothetical protein AYI70_g8892, partial [Smittium culicis]